MNEPYRLRYTNQIVGLFLLVFLLFGIVLAVFVLRASDVLVKQDRYWIEVTQAEVGDLNTGAEVFILGDRAGKVENIRFADDGRSVRVSLAIDPKKSRDIFDDSIVLLQRKYGLGTPVLVIRRGPQATETVATRLPSGSQLKNFQGEVDRVERMSREVEAVSESVRRIQQQLDPTLEVIRDTASAVRGSFETTIDSAVARAGEASESIIRTNDEVRPEAVATLQAIQSATENLESRLEMLTQKIETLVDDDLRRTLGDVRDSTDDVSSAAMSVHQSSETVTDDMQETLATLRDAAAQFQQLVLETRQVVRIVRAEAEDLPGTTARVNDAVGDAQELVGEIGNHWLLRRYNNQPTATSQVSPSVLRGGPAN